MFPRAARLKERHMTTLANRALRGVGVLLVTGAAFSTAGCVSTDAGIGSYAAKPVDVSGQVRAGDTPETTPAGIAITAGEVPGLASPYLGAVRVILSNTTSDFIQVDAVSLSFGDDLDKHVSIPLGGDIAGWGRAIAPRVSHWVGRNQIEPAYEPSSDILTDIQRFQEIRLARSAESAPSFPSEHLLAAPFSIAPGLSTIKWVLIKSDATVGTCLERMLVTLRVPQREPQRLLVRFRDKALTESEWQHAACAAGAAKSGWGV
jgi:hypothetical protein